MRLVQPCKVSITRVHHRRLTEAYIGHEKLAMDLCQDQSIYRGWSHFDATWESLVFPRRGTLQVVKPTRKRVLEAWGKYVGYNGKIDQQNLMERFHLPLHATP